MFAAAAMDTSSLGSPAGSSLGAAAGVPQRPAPDMAGNTPDDGMDGMGCQEVPHVPVNPDDWETGADADSTREEAATADADSADPTRRVWTTAELSEERSEPYALR